MWAFISAIVVTELIDNIQCCNDYVILCDVTMYSGGSRNSERGFQLIVDPKRRGFSAEEVSIFKSIQCNEKFNIFPIDNSKLWLATLTYSNYIATAVTLC